MLAKEKGQQVLDRGCQLKSGGGVGNRLDDAKCQQLLDDMCRGGGTVCGGRRDQATQVSLGASFPAMEKILQQWIIVGGKSKESLGIGGHQQVSATAWRRGSPAHLSFLHGGASVLSEQVEPAREAWARCDAGTLIDSSWISSILLLSYVGYLKRLAGAISL